MSDLGRLCIGMDFGGTSLCRTLADHRGGILERRLRACCFEE
jgi:predicted NBD/HSP70 family sugar kinase